MSNNTKDEIAVLGAGSWGTALAILLARNGYRTRLWGRNAQAMQGLITQRINNFYLPKIPFPENLIPTLDLASAVAGVQDLLIVVPSTAFQKLLITVQPYLTPAVRIAWGTKGFNPQDGAFMHEVVSRILGPTIPKAVISGPTFAREVAQGLPTAIVVGADPVSFGQDLCTYLHNETFRPYLTQDILGVELGGAVKNVLAIAVGISDGLGFGANARSALIARGLKEMVRLGIRVGAEAETLYGLSGLGDLILTATDNQSRNRRFGLALGGGASLLEAEKQIGQIVEGISNSVEVYNLAQKLQIEMPIVEQVYAITQKNLNPQQAVSFLLSRQIGGE